ncbi:MAG TPA: hypothetical protein DEF47_09080 [Herpetosiphon sp.]|uniref:YvlB/LiaX N-terminal domain-containing protein n=1 Tax=Herpetosiphon aurantiacus (strain ATCC 23779 / DSM 785 / 114-95) TaxID=316274 RepID=A9B6Z0_HERA2|nr:DUF4097 family beta strand repeat-containing protein [Herpetosiphon sp.]ABX05858.1 conserved hypothetical protein [Herpetosiphon aurantiacus DSM 785]HBW50047.1 hypothetical protein [Herpetosiphon sp.]
MQQRINVGMNPTVAVRICEGSLRVIAHDLPEAWFDVDEDEISFRAQEGHLSIERCSDDLELRLPHGAVLTIDVVQGDVDLTGLSAVHTRQIEGDISARDVQTFESDSVHGDASFTKSAKLSLANIDGDLKIYENTDTVVIKNVNGDAKISQAHNLTIINVNGDLSASDLFGDVAITRVSGDATLRGAIKSLAPIHVDGDLKLGINWLPEQVYRASANGDVVLEVADDANLSVNGFVQGDVSGMGDREPGSISLTWGTGTARLELNVQGDLSIRGGAASHSHSKSVGGTSWNTNWNWNNDDFNRAIRDFTDDLASMGRDIAAQFREMSRDWRDGKGERTAERARQATERAAERAAKAAERMSVRINEREYRFDPERIERLKEQAKRAADEGISRAYEAIGQALGNIEKNIANPNAPRPPAPPAPPAAPHAPQAPNAPHRVSISEDDGSSSSQHVAYTGDTVRISPEQAAAAQAATAAPAETPAVDKTQERLAILKMVQSGKISADEAALLLEALG